MNDEEFKKKLSEVCDWEIPIIGLHGGPAKPSRKRKSTEIIVDEFGEEQEVEVVDDDNNETIAPRIKSIFPITKPCEDCGQMITDRVVKFRLCELNSPKPYWKIKCHQCRRTRNPWTGEFNIEPDQVGRVFSAYRTEEPGQNNRSDSILVALKTPVTK